MDIVQLYQDYNLDYKTEGHKHCRPGWVNVECPWCEGNAGYHLGYNLLSDHYVCWRCGFHPVAPTVARLINIKEREAYIIVKRYGLLISSIPVVEQVKEEFIMPSALYDLNLLPQHQKYLRNRGFNPDKLEKDWDLLGSGPMSLLDKINYRHRIIIPFDWGGMRVSFDSRDITGKHTSKYMACPKNRELIPHKEILYGKQELWTDTGICVEGPTDVWRFGFNSFATSGIKYTPQQVRVMAKSFKKIWICYDANETQALQQMYNLRGDLRFRGVDAKLAVLNEGDPGSMSQEAADRFVKELMTY
jgi:hypothetical protein